MTKKEILEKLKKTYNRATDNIFSKDCHIFNNNDFTCQLTSNPDKILTVTVKAYKNVPKSLKDLNKVIDRLDKQKILTKLAKRR